MGYIYKIWNEINDKVYIGQTTCSLQKRWKEHIYASRNEKYRIQHIYRAMRKYGEQYFHIEELEHCDNEFLNEREVYWIEQFDSYYNGYNMTLGGANPFSVKNILTDKQIQSIYDLWDDGFSVIDIIKTTGFSDAQVRGRLEGYNNFSSEEAVKRGREAASKSKYKKIYQWTLKGEFVSVYESGLEAEQKTQINRKAISKALCGDSKSSGGFLWTYSETPPVIKDKQKIYQYDSNNNLIGVYKSCAEAARACGGDASTISKVCRGEKKTSRGFIWKRM